jgi:hypothetical protein
MTMGTLNRIKLPVLTKQAEPSPYVAWEQRPALDCSRSLMEEASGEVAGSAEERKRFLLNPAAYLYDRKLVDAEAMDSLSEPGRLFPGAGGSPMRADPVVVLDIVAAVNLMVALDVAVYVVAFTDFAVANESYAWCSSYFWGCESHGGELSAGGGYEAVL